MLLSLYEAWAILYTCHETCVGESDKPDVGDGSHFYLKKPFFTGSAFFRVIGSAVLIGQKAGVTSTREKTKQIDDIKNRES